MGKRILLGGDFGTNGLKLIAFDTTKETTVAASYQPYRVYMPCDGYAEHDPAAWWIAFCQAVAEVKANGAFRADEIAAVGLSCHCPTVMPMDRNGKILARAVIWADRRAKRQQERTAVLADDRLAAVNPAAVRTHMFINKLLYLKEEQPALYQQTAAFLQCNGYIIWKLTGVLSEDRSNAAAAHCYNVNTGQWDASACALFGVDMEKLPPLYDCDEVVGYVLPEMEEESGIAGGTPVVAGASDTAAAALGTGCAREGDVCFSAGTSSSTLMVYDARDKLFHTDPALMSIGHTLGGRMLNVASLSSTGASLKWLRDELFKSEADQAEAAGQSAYDRLTGMAAAAGAVPGGLLFFPYLYGEQTPFFNPDARGVFFGISAGTSRADMIRAVLEGTCFSFRQNLELLRKVGGTTPKEVIATGGPAASGTWMQILADISGCRILVPESVLGAPLGDVILAGVGAGIYGEQEKTAKDLVTIGKVFEPGEAAAERYERAYQEFVRMAAAMQPDFGRLASLRE